MCLCAINVYSSYRVTYREVKIIMIISVLYRLVSKFTWKFLTTVKLNRRSILLSTVDYSITMMPTVTMQLQENTSIATSTAQDDTKTIILISVLIPIGVVIAVFMLVGLILGYRNLFQKLKGISFVYLL